MFWTPDSFTAVTQVGVWTVRCGVLGLAIIFGLLLALASTVLMADDQQGAMSSRTIRLNPPAVSWPNHQTVQREAAREAASTGQELDATEIQATVAPDLSTITVSVVAEDAASAEQIASTVTTRLLGSFNQTQHLALSEELTARELAKEQAEQDLSLAEMLRARGEASDLELSQAAVSLAEATSALERAERDRVTLPVAWLAFAGDPRVRPDPGLHPLIVAMAGAVFALAAVGLSRLGGSHD